jgi:SSS family solute:Na+ symporter
VFWKRFTPAGVITAFVGGVALMVLGARYPGILIAPFDHGIIMNPEHPYSYIRALYNTLVCTGVAVFAALTNRWQIKLISKIRSNPNGTFIMNSLATLTVLFFLLVFFNISVISLQVTAAIGVVILVPLVVTYFVRYDEEKNTTGLTASSLDVARKIFKGGEPNDEAGEKVFVHLKKVEGDNAMVHFSKDDMSAMKANPGDLVYLSDKRKWLGGLKSIHSVFGQPHNEAGVVFVTEEQIVHGLFVKGRMLEAEKEM